MGLIQCLYSPPVSGPHPGNFLGCKINLKRRSTSSCPIVVLHMNNTSTQQLSTDLNDSVITNFDYSKQELLRSSSLFSHSLLQSQVGKADFSV